MTVIAKIGLVAIAGLAIAACQTIPAAPLGQANAEVVDVRRAMIDGVNPPALAIWDAGNNAIDDQGAIDPTKLDRATLARLREAAQLLQTYAHLMAEAPIIQASGPDLVGGRVPEGIATREQIQAAIDAHPEGFRAFSRAMGQEAQDILQAIERGDRVAVADRVTSFDGACQACHERYWYVSR